MTTTKMQEKNMHIKNVSLDEKKIITISPKGKQMKNMNCCDVARTLFHLFFLPYKSKILNRIKIIIGLMHAFFQGKEREEEGE